MPRAVSSKEAFAKSVHAAIRGLWTGNTDQFTFIDSMISTITRYLGQAFDAGAATQNVTPADYTQQEKDARKDYINQQFQFLPGFSQRIQNGNKANDGKLQKWLNQGDNWVNRWEGAFEVAKVAVGDNVPMEWELGPTEHCPSCQKLAGKVKRKNWWYENGILPAQAGATYLKCGGHKCQCQLVKTDKPLSRGRMPNLP